MAKFKSLAIVVAIASGMVASPAWAELKNAYTSMTGPQLAAILRAKGYQADLGADANGDPLINSGTGGTHFTVWFGGCDKGPVRSCTTMEFQSVFINDKNYAPSDANRCNNQYMIGRVEILSDGVAVTYGIPSANIDDDYIQAALDQWAIMVSQYQTCMLSQRT